MKKFMQKEKGITLIALIITIIIMIILVGVTLNVAIGENGILNKAKKARDKQKEAYIKEQVQFALVDSYEKALSKFNKNYYIENEEELFKETSLEELLKIQFGENYGEMSDVGLYGNINMKILEEKLSEIFKKEINNGEITIVGDFAYSINYELTYEETIEKFRELENAKNEENYQSIEYIMAIIKIATLDGYAIEIYSEGNVYVINAIGEITKMTEGERQQEIESRTVATPALYEIRDSAILKYKGKAETVYIPSMALGDKIDTLGGTYDGKSGADQNDWYKVFAPEAMMAILGGEEEFSEENLDEIKTGLLGESGLPTDDASMREALEKQGINAEDKSGFELLKMYLHAYQEEDGTWVCWGKVTDTGIEFVDKPKLVKTIVIPETITKIENHALQGNPSLINVHFPAALISQETKVFTTRIFNGANSELKLYIETPEGWGDAEKEAALSKYTYELQDVAEIIWSEDEGYIDMYNR